jgi:regulatory protein
MKKKYHSYDEALSKLQAYCAYQERCHKEVRQKLRDLGIWGDEVDEIISELITANFLNELRYAKAFAGGKFRVKKWGKKRIVQALKFNQVSAYSIKKALQSELPDEEYELSLRQVLEKKNRLLHESNPYKRRQKLVKFATDKGYESHLVWQIINSDYPIKK